MAHHQLHHRPEYENIRSAYDCDDKPSPSDYGSHFSYQQSSGSDRSYRTQPTSYGSSTKPSPRVHHYQPRDFPDDPGDWRGIIGGRPSRFFDDRHPQESPRASVETYASTVQSEEDLEEEEEEDVPEYELPQYTARPYEPRILPATPSDFSELFPSHRRLAIRHDDSTLDGNMNLRVDTEVMLHGGRRCDMTLFHLRMHDLRDREFSLRRYCRDSGREVCHSVSKQQKPSSGRPSFQRSLSNALSSMRTRSDSKCPTMSSLKRNDSGYGSAQSSIDFDRDERPVSASAAPKTQPVDPNCVKLEFSNYAQVDIKRAGVKGSKRYEFEYWGTHYAWRRVVRKDAATKETSYQLTKSGSERALAYVVPSPLTPAQAEEEQSKGGWIPPCSMWIADEGLVHGQKDVADVVIASGLIALVDDAIRARFHSPKSQQMIIPKVEYIGPKRLINEMFKRDGSGLHSRQNSRQSSSSRPSSSHRA